MNMDDPTQETPTALSFSEAPNPRPTPKSQSERNAKYRQLNGGEANRPFLAWDGEGITLPSGEHLYIFIANSYGGCLVAESGLTRNAIFKFVLDEAARYEADMNIKPIHVIYGGGYDFNMWLKGTDKATVERLYKTGAARVPSGSARHYSIEWRPGKYFRIAHGGRAVRMFDVVSFFQRPFVAACDEYLRDAFEDRELIVKNKGLRSSFTLADLDEMRLYTDAELRNLVSLMNALRSALNKANLRPSRWDGPGAVAARLLKNYKIKDCMYGPEYETSPEVSHAVRCAYAGGRFEQLKYGISAQSAYEYDVNSAYPSALRYVPCLAHGQWVHVPGDHPVSGFAVHHLRYRAPGSRFARPFERPQPLFVRYSNGSICYPTDAEGWYWTPEYEAAKRYVEKLGGSLDVIESWGWVHDDGACGRRSPFDFVEGLFNKRRALKKAGDGAHFGIKLGLNSLYGKLAQQIGYDAVTGRIPPYHQLEWAGYTTSHCRAAVLTAALQDIDSVIAFETDALFTTRKLSVDIGSGLGQFEAMEFDTLSYCQSGMYFFTEGGEDKVKSRGVDRGTLTLADMVYAMVERQPMRASSTRFYGAGLALSQDWNKWCRWVTAEKTITVGPTAEMKRSHGGYFPCRTCAEYGEHAPGRWHETTVAHHLVGKTLPLVSQEFPVLWANPDPEMAELAALRNLGPEQWDEE